MDKCKACNKEFYWHPSCGYEDGVSHPESQGYCGWPCYTKTTGIKFEQYTGINVDKFSKAYLERLRKGS